MECEEFKGDVNAAAHRSKPFLPWARMPEAVCFDEVHQYVDGCTGRKNQKSAIRQLLFEGKRSSISILFEMACRVALKGVMGRIGGQSGPYPAF